MSVTTRRGIIKMDAAADAVTTQLRVVGLLYKNAAATTALVVTDGNDNGVLYDVAATVANTTTVVNFSPGIQVNGVTLKTLPTGGVLYIYYAE